MIPISLGWDVRSPCTLAVAQVSLQSYSSTSASSWGIDGYITKRKPHHSPLVGTALTRLSARIASLLKADLMGDLVAELPERVAAILARELPERVAAILVHELPERVEAILARELPERVAAILARELPERVEAILPKQPQNALTGYQLYRPNIIVAGSAAGEYMAASNTLARDFLHAEFREFCRLCNYPVVMHRKLWEWAFIYERLRGASMLRPGMRGLGFAVGAEKLPSLFASLGAHITATDAPVGGHWAEHGQYASGKEQLFYPDTISREIFDDCVSFEFCDMNDIAAAHLNNYDFCWSSCAFEHLGSLQHGIDFVINSLEQSLIVGGIACHTTELNLSSDDETIEAGVDVIYRKRDLERLCTILEERGHWVQPLRIEPGTLPPDYLVDVPPWGADPHLKLLLGNYVTTSVGLVARRGR